jgi:short-subunit dehydrogenase
MKILKDKTALVTGGSRGIGPRIAQALARDGVHVAVTARSEESLQAVAAGLEDLGVRSLAVPADITNSAERETLMQRVIEKFGAIDILVNNAGIESEGAFLRLSEQDIEHTVQTNLTAALRLTHRVLTSMVEKGQGHVVTICSLAEKYAYPTVPFTVPPKPAWWNGPVPCG